MVKVQLRISLSLILIACSGAGCATGGDHASGVAGSERLEGPAASGLRGDGLEIIPEYEASTGLMISHYLAQKEEMMPFLLDVLKNFELYVIMPRDNKGREDPRLKLLFEAIERSVPDDLKSRARSGVQPFGSRHPPNFSKDRRKPWAGGIWARDWGPLSARLPGKGNGEGGSTVYFDFDYSRMMAYEDSAPGAFVEFLGSRPGGEQRAVPDPPEGVQRSLVHGSIPIRYPGGNFMIGGDSHCMLAEGSHPGNRKKMGPAEREKYARDIGDTLREGLPCKRVSIFESMPHEETGHIDMWAKFLSDDAVLVASLEDSQRSRVPEKHAAVFDEVQTYLNQRAAEIESLGYRVVRIPNPVPVFKANWKYLFRSYVNTLFLVKGDGRKFAYVPRYHSPAIPLPGGSSEYPDVDLLEGYETIVSRVLGNAGYSVMFVPADELISKDGAIHCVGMQVRAPKAGG